MRIDGRFGLGNDLGSELAVGSEYSRVLHNVITRGRHGGGESAEQRQRIHVECLGAIAEGLFEDDTHESFRPRHDAVLSDGRAKDVSK